MELKYLFYYACAYTGIFIVTLCSIGSLLAFIGWLIELLLNVLCKKWKPLWLVVEYCWHRKAYKEWYKNTKSKTNSNESAK